MILLRAGWVLPVTAPPMADGVVAVDGSRVAWVGPAGAPGMPPGRLMDLGPGILLPGLVNAHCHLELSHLRGLWRETHGFVPWVTTLIARRAASDQDDAREALRAALDEMEATGTAAVGDVTNQADHLDLLAKSPMEGVVYLEILSWDPQRAGATLAEWRVRQRELEARGAGRGWRVRLAAHAPHSVSGSLLRSLAAAGELASMHVAETRDEVAFIREGGGEWQSLLEERGLGHVGWTGAHVGVVDYLDAIGALPEHMLAVHCVEISAGDAALLAARRVRPVLCPRSNRNLGAGRAPLSAMLAAGLRPALGTDSLASVESLDLGAEMALLHDTFPDVPPQRILEMATINGAEALGLQGHGAIEVGRRAALAFASTATAVQDPVDVIVSGRVRPRLLEEIDQA